MSKRIGTVAIALVLLLVVGIGAFVVITGRVLTYVIRDHQTTTQLLWNHEQAYLIVGVRRDGWSGSRSEFVWQVIRGFLRVPFQFNESRTWVIVTHVLPGNVRSGTEDGQTFHIVRPFDGEIYWAAGRVMKWNGERFEEVPESEATRFKTVKAKTSGDAFYSAIDGWSSRINLLNQGDGRFEYPLTFKDGNTVVIAISDRSNASRVSLRLQTPSNGTVDVLSLDEEFRTVSADEYSRLLHGPMPR